MWVVGPARVLGPSLVYSYSAVSVQQMLSRERNHGDRKSTKLANSNGCSPPSGVWCAISQPFNLRKQWYNWKAAQQFWLCSLSLMDCPLRLMKWISWPTSMSEWTGVAKERWSEPYPTLWTGSGKCFLLTLYLCKIQARLVEALRVDGLTTTSFKAWNQAALKMLNV